MNIMVLGTANNVGKSTIVREVLYSGFRKQDKDVLILQILNTNKGSLDFKGINEHHIKAISNIAFKDIFINFLAYDNVIVDLGTSKLDEILKILFIHSPVILNEIDLIVLPYAHTNSKDMIEFTMLIYKMIENGIDPNKIKIVFNKNFNQSKFESDMDSLFLYDENIGKIFLKYLKDHTSILDNHFYMPLGAEEALNFLYTKKQLSTYFVQSQSVIDFKQKQEEFENKFGTQSEKVKDLIDYQQFIEEVRKLTVLNFKLFQNLIKT